MAALRNEMIWYLLDIYREMLVESGHLCIKSGNRCIKLDRYSSHINLEEKANSPVDHLYLKYGVFDG
jgi:hypothetical protein